MTTPITSVANAAAENPSLFRWIVHGLWTGASTACTIPAAPLAALGTGVVNQGASSNIAAAVNWGDAKATCHFVFSWIREKLGKFIADGLEALSKSEYRAEISKILTPKLSTAKDGLEGLFSSFGRMRGTGGVLFAAGAATVLIGGFLFGKNAFASMKRGSDVSYGRPVDNVRNPFVHYLQAGTSGVAALGLLTAIASPVGWGMFALGAAGTAAIWVYRKAVGGYHVFNYPRKLWRPFSYPFEWFKNDSTGNFYSGI